MNKLFYKALLFILVLYSNNSFGQCFATSPYPATDPCYQQVIANDPYCCNGAWDMLCQMDYDACTPPGGGGGGTGCNTNTSICTAGTAGPFNFSTASSNPSSCLDFFNGSGSVSYAYIILYITQSGDLNLLIDGNNTTGCIDVSIFDITNAADPCSALSTGTEIGCNYASMCDGCNEFGSNFPGCDSEVPAPYVNTGDVLMILIEDWSSQQSSFTLQLDNGPGSAQTGPPNGTITPAGPYNQTDPPATMTAVDGGGTWSASCGSCIDPVTGEFDPGVAGQGTHQICYDIGSAPCDDSDCINVNVGATCIDPVLDPINNVTTCDSYVLPAISGTDLTGNEAYFSGPGGTGTQYNIGDNYSVGGVTTLYAFDETGTTPNCSDEVSFTVTIDIDNPTITCPGNLTATCNISEQPPYTDFTAFTNAGGSANDLTGNIDPSSFNLVSEISDGNSCPETVTRTYEIADDCGHTSICTQDIVINDITAPTGDAPTDLTVACISDVPVEDINSVTNLNDNCTSLPSVTFINDVNNGGACPIIITRTYRIEDDCGNFTDVTQDITVNDIEAPLINGTLNTLTENGCVLADASTPASTVADLELMGVTISDNCTSNPNLTVTSNDVAAGTCPLIITRTYSIEDACGNVTTVDQTINLEDNTPPTGNAPADVNVFCISDLPAVDINSVSGITDNCSNPTTVTHISDVSDNNLCAGEQITRTYRIEDLCGNFAEVTQIITIDAINPIFTLAYIDPTSCIANDGSITISGLTPNTDYALSYDFNGVNTGSNNFTSDINGESLLQNLASGTYNNFIITLANCTSCQTIAPDNLVLTAPNAPTVDAGADQTICIGESVTLSATTSDGSIANWNNGAIDGTPLSPSVTTTYTATITAVGCTASDQMIVTVNPSPTVLINASSTNVCFGENVTLNGTGAQTYTWDNGIQDNTPFAPPLGPTTYTVNGTDVNGCEGTNSIIITANPSPTASFSINNNKGCTPLTVDFINNSSAGTTAKWEFGNGATALNASNISHEYISPGCYDVKLTVTDNIGCKNDTTLLDIVCVDQLPFASFSQNYITVKESNTNVSFINSSLGANAYNWFFVNLITPTTNEENPSFEFPTEYTSYPVMLVAYTENGCTDTAKSVVIVEEELLFYVPNTFTPDGDQYNQVFKPIMTSGFDPQKYTLLIYNRWGEPVFESHNTAIGWDGTYQGKLVEDGVYVWKIVIHNPKTDERKEFQGHLNVLK